MQSFKKYYSLTFLIGFGFFTMGLMDILYDTYVPIYLRRFFEQKFLIGIIMTLDNILAIFLIPIFSALSDKTTSRLGRRMPYIIILLPLSALAFAFIPFGALWSALALILVIFLFNLVKQSARGPVVALMPDLIPGQFRSQANGVINLMGGLGTIIGSIGLARLMDLAVPLPGFPEPVTEILSLPVAGVLVIMAVILLVIFVREKYHTEAAEKTPPVLKSIRIILGDKNKSALFIMISLFLWFLGYQGILPFLGLYSEEIIGVSKGTAGLASGVVAVMYVAFAIPAGYWAVKKGRKRVIRTSLILLAIILGLSFIHSLIICTPQVNAWLLSSGSGQLSGLISFYVILAFFGIFWVNVNVNSFPMLWEMAEYNNIGIYTGLYYFFAQLAAISAPPLTGLIIDLFGYQGIFAFGALCMLAACCVMGLVTSGEVRLDKQKEKI